MEKTRKYKIYNPYKKLNSKNHISPQYKNDPMSKENYTIFVPKK